MENYIVKTSHFLIEADPLKKSIGKIFIAKPSIEKEIRDGKLFGILDIKNNTNTAMDFVNLIIEEIKTYYYYQKNDYKNNNLNKESTALETTFEKVLQNTNRSLAIFLENKNLILDPIEINIIIGAIKDKNICLAQIGNMGAYLIHYYRKNDYRIININENPSGVVQKINPLNFFSQTICGKINVLDYLILSSPNILDYISLEKIKNVVINNSMVDSVKELKNILLKINNNETFSFITIRLQPVTKPVSVAPLKTFDFIKAASSDSMKELNLKEKITEKLLSPSFRPDFKKSIKTLKNTYRSYIDKIKNFSTASQSIISKKLDFDKTIKLNVFKNTKNLITKIYIIFKIIIKKIFLNRFTKITARKCINLLKKIYDKFRRLSRTQKFVVIAIIIFAILFFQNTIRLSIKNARIKREEIMNNTLITISQKKDAAIASLIYQDEENAKKLLLEAKKLLDQLAPNLKTKPEIATLKQEIEEQLKNLQHLEELKEPILLANFKNLDINTELANILIYINNELFSQNYYNLGLYKLNLDKKIISPVHFLSENIGRIKLATVLEQKLYFLNENLTLFSFDPNNNNLNPIPITFPENPNIKAMDNYNNRLYLLDINNNQIFRYDFINNGFQKMTKWINDTDINLKDAVDITIDGFIYILKNNGNIDKFINGKKSDFEISIFDPPLQSPTKLKTTIDSKYLYILDPASQRLIVINKEGKLIKQYHFTKLNNIKDFEIIEQEKKIFILHDSSIYGIPAQHLIGESSTP